MAEDSTLCDVFCTGHHAAVTARVTPRTTVNGTHAVLECVGTRSAIEMALGVVRDGGTVGRVGASR